jgi:hypothetical protein
MESNALNYYLQNIDLLQWIVKGMKLRTMEWKEW